MECGGIYKHKDSKVGSYFSKQRKQAEKCAEDPKKEVIPCREIPMINIQKKAPSSGVTPMGNGATNKLAAETSTKGRVDTRL
jgi:hypothetical protein